MAKKLKCKFIYNMTVKLANISDKTSSFSCHMFPWQQLDLSNRQKFSSMVGHFKIMQTQGNKESV